MDMKTCVSCKGTKFHSQIRKFTRTIAGHKFTADIPANGCEPCGELFYDAAPLIAFERSIALKLAESGDASGEAFQFMRKVVGMSAEALAVVLSMSRGTVVRMGGG